MEAILEVLPGLALPAAVLIAVIGIAWVVDGG